MKDKQEKRKDALFRLQRQQAGDITKLSELRAQLAELDKRAPQRKVLVRAGLFAGFSTDDQKDAVRGHIAMVGRDVVWRAKEIVNLQGAISRNSY